MFYPLNASDYEQTDAFYKADFESILSKVILCYNQMLIDNVSLSNKENDIRDYMLDRYLKKQEFKKKHEITGYLFDKELQESTGRIDIRIMPVNPFISDESYYIIECKRLNAKNQTGKTGLNADYIAEGICRFITDKYSCYYKTNGMIGFIIEHLNIDENTGCINSLLNSDFKTANTVAHLKKRDLLPGFHFGYYSIHTGCGKDLVIYHLMLDLSKNIA